MKLRQFIERKTYVFLFLILLLGGLLRFYQLTSVPPALNWDEVAFGYNAYSIIHTGRDEYGKVFPLYWRSLDDYKRPVYSYATVISVALVGLNDFAVRLPSALIGTLTILVAYLLALEFFKKKHIALLAALLLAITPWHIQFSHAAFEGTMGFFFMSLGVLLALYGIRKNLWWLPASALAFGLSMYSYLGQRVSVPILIVTIVFVYHSFFWKKLKTRKRAVMFPLLLCIFVLSIFGLSLTRDALFPEGNIRFKATSIFNQREEYEPAFKRMQDDARLGINLPRRIFHDSSAFTSFELVLRGYLTHFSPDFFFFDLGQQHRHAPGLGILYVWMLPFLLIGIFVVARSETVATKTILAVWILGPPVAASVTFQIPHALRVIDMMMPLLLVIALGITVFYSYLAKKQRALFFLALIVLVATAALYLFYFVHQYTVHLPIERSRDWVYGRKEAVAYAESVKAKYKKIIVSTKLDYPYIFFLYYTKYDPSKYLKEGGTKSGGFAETENAFDNYEFHTFTYPETASDAAELYIGLPTDFPAGVTPVKKINYLNGDEAIYIVERRRE